VVPDTKTQEKHMVGLPLMVVGPADVGRLIRELDNLDNLLSQEVLKGNADKLEPPRTSQLMKQSLEMNKLDVLQPSDRRRLMELLTLVKEKAPLLHISFSADPAPAFVEKLMTWLRREIHPLVLLTIGLQPNIGAGCIVRSTNKYFDFSLRQDFINKREMLMSKLVGEETSE
jgi:hypothetical protein